MSDVALKKLTDKQMALVDIMVTEGTEASTGSRTSRIRSGQGWICQCLQITEVTTRAAVHDAADE